MSKDSYYPDNYNPWAVYLDILFWKRQSNSQTFFFGYLLKQGMGRSKVFTICSYYICYISCDNKYRTLISSTLASVCSCPNVVSYETIFLNTKIQALKVNSRKSCKMPTKQRLWQKLSETSFYRKDFCLQIFFLIFPNENYHLVIKFPTSFSDCYPSRNTLLLALLCRAQTVIQMSQK